MPTNSQDVATIERVPRDAADDYSEAIVASRRHWLEKHSDAKLEALAGAQANACVFRGNIENLRVDGVGAPYVIDGAMDGATFLAWRNWAAIVPCLPRIDGLPWCRLG